MKATSSSEIQGSHILEDSIFQVTDITSYLTTLKFLFPSKIYHIYHFTSFCDLQKLSCEGTSSIHGISVEIRDQVFNCHISKYSHMREFYACSIGYISFIIPEKQYAKVRKDNECSFHSTSLTKETCMIKNEINLCKSSNVHRI
jgi:hypothetical protein